MKVKALRERSYGLYSFILLYTKSIEVHFPNILLASQQSFDCGNDMRSDISALKGFS